MIDFILGSIPSWVWIALAVAGALVVIGILKGDGWKWALGIAGAGLLAFLQSRAHQRGAAVERARQDAADDKARDTITETRDDVRAMPDDHLDAEVDKWTRR